MLHVLAVQLALGGARRARDRARFDRGAHHAGIRLGLTGDDACGNRAEIRAVIVEADALRQQLRILLCAARIRARDTCLRAVEAGLQAREE